VQAITRWLPTAGVVDAGRVGGAATVVSMPVAAGRSLLLLQLTPSPAVDAAIRRAGWETLELDLTGGGR
jgi:hypothetical protein